MQVIFEYVSAGDLWGLAIVAVVTAILAANSNYQKHRALAHDRKPAPAAQQAKRAASGVAAHA